MRRDWSGTLIGLATLPVFFFFSNRGEAEFGLSACLALGMIAIAVRLNWNLKKYVWFWATIALVLALHVPLLSKIQWTTAKVHTIAFPLALADFLVVSGAIRLAQMLFSKDTPSAEDD